MSKVHPIFEEVLAVMSANDIPCRVSADIRKYHSDLNHAEPVAFNEYDDVMMRDIVGDHLRKPIQDLLITQSQIRAIRGSFGDDSVNKEKLLESIFAELDALREACIDAYKDL